MRICAAGRSLKFIFAAAAVAVAGVGAAKADGPRPYVIGATDLQGETDWTGFYIGGKVGGAWSDISWTQDNNAFTNNTGDQVSFSPSGVAGGVIGGGNLQVGHWVFGAELSYQGVSLSQTVASPFFPATDTFSAKLDWLATVEGRVGYSFDRWLVFGKIGWVGSHVNLTEVNAATGAAAAADDFVDGYTLGGGVELLCWSNVVLGLEYDYTNLNLSTPANCPLCPVGIVGGSAPQAVSGDATMNAVMARATYLFRPED
jgi:outer membrane immunogenic protein